MLKTALKSALISALCLLALPIMGWAAPPRFATDAVLNVKSTYAAGEPIVIGCSCSPAAGVTIQAQWKSDPGVQFKDVSPDGLQKYAWAKVGRHTVEVELFLARTHKVKVFVPDKDHPEDFTKAHLEELTVLDGWDVQKITGEFVQQGDSIPPPSDQVAVPYLIGKRLQEVSSALENVALLLANKTDSQTAIVAAQSPGPGTLANKGSSVSVTWNDTPPPPVVTGIKGAVLFYEFSKLPAPKSAGDVAVREYLASQCGSNWRIWDDDDGNLTNPPKDLADLWVQGKSARSAGGKGNDDPWIEIELKDGRKVGRPLDDNTLQFLKSYGG